MTTSSRRVFLKRVVATSAAAIWPTAAASQPPSVDRQWLALELPEHGRGPSRAIKHVTFAHCPLNGRLYMTGGDYSGPFTDSSYRQETYSLSLAGRLANVGDRNAGWRLEYPYCSPPGQVQPKHPDHVGWQWDSKRELFWMVPGTMDVRSAGNCEGETPGYGSDPQYPMWHVMVFDPKQRRWTDWMADVGHRTNQGQWMSIYDPVSDTLVRFDRNGRAGGVTADVFAPGDRPGQGKWTQYGPFKNALGADPRIEMDHLAFDPVQRVIYGTDPFAGRLHRYAVTTNRMEDLGPTPQKLGKNNWTSLAFDTENRILCFHPTGMGIWAYHPDTQRWEQLPTTTTRPGIRAYGCVMVYDPAERAFLLLGGEYPANPFIYVFRYA